MAEAATSSPNLFSTASRTHAGLHFPASLAVRCRHMSELGPIECEQKALHHFRGGPATPPHLQVCSSLLPEEVSELQMVIMAEPLSAPTARSRNNHESHLLTWNSGPGLLQVKETASRSPMPLDSYTDPIRAVQLTP